MQLYRGTPEPEGRPLKREFPCAFFSPNFDYAAVYAAGEESGTKTGVGYVQKYDVGRQKLLKRWTKRAVEFAKRYWKSDDITESDLTELFRYPDRRWVKMLQEAGYTGTTNGEDICIFDPSKAKFLERWEVTSAEVEWEPESRIPNR